MARGGKRPGAGRKPNPFKDAPPSVERVVTASRTYDEQVAIEARKLCELGATDLEVADFFGVSVSTIYRWKIDFADFCEAMRSGKDASDERVERSLYHRAVGHPYDAVKIMAVAGQIVTTPYREHVPPDTTAAFVWLKNRRKEKWRDKQEIEHSGEVGLGGGLPELVKRVRDAVKQG